MTLMHALMHQYVDDTLIPDRYDARVHGHDTVYESS